MTIVHAATANEPSGSDPVAAARPSHGKGFNGRVGCVVVIPHDRALPDRVATHILAFEGDSKVNLFDGAVRRWVGGTTRAADSSIGAAAVGRRLCDAVAEAEQCSRNFSEYEEWRKKQLGEAALRPHRITYGKLTR